MTTVFPDFYPQFRCIASECKHTCCAGWEIDIDDDTLDLYDMIPGESGEKLRSTISYEPTPHFILTAEERCPHLRSDNLCALMLKHGEGALCDICTEHPRFYNDFGDRTEAGLGLCCEEAARLLLCGEEPLSFIVDTDGEPDAHDEAAAALFALRDTVMTILSDSTVPLEARMMQALQACGVCRALPCAEELKQTLKKLEYMDNAWATAVEQVQASLNVPDSIACERIAEYFVYRHFGTDGMENAGRYLWFALFSTLSVAALAETGLGLQEALRLYSAEVEYSDMNIDTVLNQFF